VITGPLLLATRSRGKLRELRPMCEAAGVAVVDLDDAGIPESPDEGAVERFATFEENAVAKARYFHEHSGMPVIADDSGLEVLALGGAPGVCSKRWAARADLSGQALDDANNALLCRSMLGVADRRARYVCVAAFADGRGVVTATGSVEGTIVADGRGTLGFGYDPYFFSPELGRTFGETAAADKERVSHRGRAFRALFERLAAAR
jgi:XTP/dITP diphosphohydrolase